MRATRFDRWLVWHGATAVAVCSLVLWGGSVLAWWVAETVFGMAPPDLGVGAALALAPALAVAVPAGLGWAVFRLVEDGALDGLQAAGVGSLRVSACLTLAAALPLGLHHLGVHENGPAARRAVVDRHARALHADPLAAVTDVRGVGMSRLPGGAVQILAGLGGGSPRGSGVAAAEPVLAARFGGARVAVPALIPAPAMTEGWGELEVTAGDAWWFAGGESQAPTVEVGFSAARFELPRWVPPLGMRVEQELSSATLRESPAAWARARTLREPKDALADAASELRQRDARVWCLWIAVLGAVAPLMGRAVRAQPRRVCVASTAVAVLVASQGWRLFA